MIQVFPCQCDFTQAGNGDLLLLARFNPNHFFGNIPEVIYEMEGIGMAFVCCLYAQLRPVSIPAHKSKLQPKHAAANSRSVATLVSPGIPVRRDDAVSRGAIRQKFERYHEYRSSSTRAGSHQNETTGQ